MSYYSGLMITFASPPETTEAEKDKFTAFAESRFPDATILIVPGSPHEHFWHLIAASQSAKRGPQFQSSLGSHLNPSDAGLHQQIQQTITDYYSKADNR